MNLVSREKAIDVAIDEYNRGYKEGFEAASLKWIPCSERLPEELTDVLISDLEGDVYITRLIDVINDRAEWLAEIRAGADIVAWMPLPESYKGE